MKIKNYSFLLFFNMKIKSIKAWAVVDKNKPKIKVIEIYDDKDVLLNKGEKIIRVEIKAI